MRHKNAKAVLNRPADQRKAMIRNLITSLFLYGKVQTTDAKAKALASEAEKLITRVKKQEPQNAVRALKRVLFSEVASKKALDYIQKSSRTSGFTRRTKIGFRSGDGALLVHVDLIEDSHA